MMITIRNFNFMKEQDSQQEKYLKAQKKVKSIRGFYTHIFSSFIIIPLNIFINITFVPQFHWFWFFIAAWILGLFLHWFFVFKASNLIFSKKWEQKKIQEYIHKS